MERLRLSLPLNEGLVKNLRAGDEVLLSGRLLTARDAAHKRMVEALSPAPPGRVVGAAGPTTSGRMDPYTPALLERGLRGMIGKGRRSPEVVAALLRYRGIYFVTYGGAGALLSRAVKAARVLAYADLGPEAIHEFIVECFPAVVANDAYGGDIFENLSTLPEC